MTLPKSSGQRKISAIMFTDIVGYSKMMTMDEQNAFRLLEIHDDICEKLIAGRNGRLVKKIGDSIFAEFSSSLDASQCAIEIQNELRVYNSDKNTEDQIWVKIGIHVGDVVEKGGDLFGEGVNIASRIQPLAEKGGICISNEVFRSIQNRKEISAASLGHYELKNILEEWNIYRLFTSEIEYKDWAEKTYSEKRKAERKAKFHRTLSIAFIVIIIALINIPIIRQ
ncbi:MAG: adenylate/guanylate cyclase domain-containing protein [FCB group bacterium]|nr:adenylate/guanylate cyclase domain-containing protein [FCB group bacterium]MBL7122546.1 adenylate/guanylate cyclase domain-containing protein [Candidatus Neomarinimicrobiota bacterium]